MTQAVIAEIGAGGRIVGPEPLHAVGLRVAANWTVLVHFTAVGVCGWSVIAWGVATVVTLSIAAVIALLVSIVVSAGPKLNLDLGIGTVG